MLTARQCKAARAYLGWSAEELGKRAKVGVVTVFNFEGGLSDPKASTLTRLQAALEKGGMEFMAEDAPSLGGGPGVRLRK